MTSSMVLSPTGTRGLGITLVNGFKRVPLPPAIITTGSFIFSRCCVSGILKKSDQKYTSTNSPSLLTTGMHSALSESILFLTTCMSSLGKAYFFCLSTITESGLSKDTLCMIARWISPMVTMPSKCSSVNTKSILTFWASICFKVNNKLSPELMIRFSIFDLFIFHTSILYHYTNKEITSKHR